MSLEIRELVIIATVNNQGNATPGGAGGGEEMNENTLNEVTARVLEIIKEKMER